MPPFDELLEYCAGPRDGRIGELLIFVARTAGRHDRVRLVVTERPAWPSSGNSADAPTTQALQTRVSAVSSATGGAYVSRGR